MNSTLRNVRKLAALILLAAMFLPLSECSWRENHAPSSPMSVSQWLFPQSNQEFDYHYAYQQVDFTWFGVLTLVAFTWPLLFVIFLEHRSRLRLLVQFIELLLCVGTVYWIHLLTFGGRYLYGAYVSTIAAATFAFAALIGCTQKMMHRKRPNQAMEFHS